MVIEVPDRSRKSKKGDKGEESSTRTASTMTSHSSKSYNTSRDDLSSKISKVDGGQSVSGLSRKDDGEQSVSGLSRKERQELTENILEGQTMTYESNDKLRKDKIATWVRTVGFRNQKFAQAGVFTVQSHLFKRCLKQAMPWWTGTSEEAYKEWGKFIRNTLNHRRNCCQTMIRSKMKGM
jgi:hypothetical protein